MSLIKFLNQQGGGNGRGKLFWGRALEDGLPFRGIAPPNLTQEEFEEQTVRVADPFNGTFRTWIKEENDVYLKVMDKVLNGWARIIHEEHWREKIKLDGRSRQFYVHYLVWAEYYLETGARAPAHNPLEMFHGQGNFPGAVGPG